MLETGRNIEIIPARSEQIPLILGFVRKLAEYERLSHEVSANEELLKRYLFGERPAAEVVLAYLDGNPVGFAMFLTSFSSFAGRPGFYLEDLFVDPEARGLGVGKALLRYVAGVAKERDYGRVEWSVLDWNKPSIDFYLGLGAEPLHDWTVYRLAGDPLEKLASG